MEDNCADIGEALDGLDDFFQDENLFQDLEDLGKVLDELNEADDGEESSDAGESSAASKRDVEFDPDKLSEIDDILNSPAKKSPTEELEDGEISEVDEKNELKELKKRKTEVINKMKKLVKHKIQLTNQRNDLLLQLQSNTQLDKVTTLLKENSQLVKAISNQIFRMNPEIKVLNGKIKELEVSIGTETEESKDQKVESTSVQDFTASRKDLENIENFFNRFSSPGTVKNKKEEEGGKLKKDEKGDESKSFGSNAIKRFLSLDESCGPSKTSSAELNKNIIGKPPLASQKSRRLVSDENKIKMMFEKVCEITEKKQSSLSSTSGSDTSLADRRVTHDFEHRKESQLNTKPSTESVENSIYKRLKEIRLQGTKIPAKTNVVDLTAEDQEKSKRKISPIRVNKGRISPIRLDKGLSQSDSFENLNRKRKIIGDREFDETSLASKKVKETESSVASNISRSLLERLGSVPVKDKSLSNSLTESEEEVPKGFIPDKLNVIRPPKERTSYWCQCCSRGFQSTQTYVSHLESLKHLRVAMAKQSGTKAAHCDAPKDDTWSEANDAWYKGSTNKQGDESAARSEAPSGAYCIAVVVNDTFCTKKQLGHFHSRCFAHAKCLLRDKDNRIGYAPDSCSVCMEYLQHSHSSLKCCERIFRIFKTFKKRCGLSFDWEEKSLKDWFFDNYRKVQDGSDTAKKSTVSYEDFKAQMKSCGSSSQNVGNGAGAVIEQGIESGKELASKERLSCIKPLDKKNVEREESPKTISKSSSAAGKQASSVNSKSLELRSVLGQKLISFGNKLTNSSEDFSKNDPFCNLLMKYSNASRDTSETNQHSYNVVFEKDDPFITEVCKKTLLDKCIPSLDLLQGIHTQFRSTNIESSKLMDFLHRKLFHVSDLSFKFGELEGYCSPKLLERFNFTISLAKSHFNVYAALLAIVTTVRGFSEVNAGGQDVSEFHKCLMESIECLAKEMVNPLIYCVSMALQDKHNLRRSGFKLQGENNTIGTLVRYNIFSKSLFDEQALKTTYNSSKQLSKFINTEKSLESKLKGFGGVSL